VASAPAHSGGCGCGGHSHEAEPAAATDACAKSCGSLRGERRFHAALGAALIAFLAIHFALAALAFSPARFEALSARLHAVAGKTSALSIILLGALVGQGAVGLRLLANSGWGLRVSRRRTENHWLLFAQRWSGALVLIFVLVHAVMILVRGAGPSLAEARAALFAGSLLLVVFYGLSIAAIAFHAGYGIWTGSHVWGLREKNPALWRVAALLVGLVLAALGAAALRALSA
jgi:succinate dehydrogenase/fumarate reductase cytochrome b subunit